MRPALFALLLTLSPLPAAAIINGVPAGGEVAAQTALIVSTRGASCSGAVLARDLVLTAAHCVAPQADYAVAILGGAAPRLIKIARVAVHPRFDANQFKTRRPTPDLALVKLAEPLPAGFRAARLAREPALPRPGDAFTIAGFGMFAERNEKSAGTLRTLTLPAIGTTGGIMVRLSGGGGACTGDSGGPAFRNGAVAAVIGWTTGPKGPGCGNVTGATLVAQQREWIEATARALGSAIGN
jgi:secreted trypsin-like serine protease